MKNKRVVFNGGKKSALMREFYLSEQQFRSNIAHAFNAGILDGELFTGIDQINRLSLTDLLGVLKNIDNPDLGIFSQCVIEG